MAGKPRQRDSSWQRFVVRVVSQGHGLIVWDRVTARRAASSSVYKDIAKAEALAKDLNENHRHGASVANERK